MGRLFLGCGFFSFPVLELDELPLDSGDFDFFGLDPFFFFLSPETPAGEGPWISPEGSLETEDAGRRIWARSSNCSQTSPFVIAFVKISAIWYFVLTAIRRQLFARRTS
jgi:hypothetical protein